MFLEQRKAKLEKAKRPNSDGSVLKGKAVPAQTGKRGDAVPPKSMAKGSKPSKKKVKSIADLQALKAAVVKKEKRSY